MRGVVVLFLALLLAACGGTPRPDRTVSALVDEQLAAMLPLCIDLPDDDWLRAGIDNLEMRGRRRTDGSAMWRPEFVAMTDALLEAELIGPPVEAETSSGWIKRRYPLTELGKRYFRSRLARTGYNRDPVPAGFCYAHSELAQVIEVTPIHREKCGEWRSVTLLYYHANFPPWIENPKIVRAFPARVGSSDEGATRFERFQIQRRKGAAGWTRGLLFCGKRYPMM